LIFDWWLDPTTASFSEWARSPFVMDPMNDLKDNFDTRERWEPQGARPLDLEAV